MVEKLEQTAKKPGRRRKDDAKADLTAAAKPRSPRTVGRPRQADARAELAEEREPKGRRQRVPLGSMRLKLTAPKRRGFHRRWIVDRANRLQEAQLAGYEFVRDEESIEDAGMGRDSRVKQYSGEEILYLMEIPQAFYDEDQRAKQAEIDEIDETLRRGHVKGANAKDRDAYYAGSDRGDIIVETSDGSR